MEVNSLPVFLNYGEEERKVDQGCEALQDFFISWTLRCAMERYRKDNVLLNSYSKIYFWLYCMDTIITNLNIAFKIWILTRFK
jgi:hypothetical protein